MIDSDQANGVEPIRVRITSVEEHIDPRQRAAQARFHFARKSSTSSRLPLSSRHSAFCAEQDRPPQEATLT
jgi:hypothetical protein